jgi:hypothetical protein
VIARAAAKQHEAKRRVQGRVFVNRHDVCAAELSVPIAQQAAVPVDERKVETMDENKQTKTEEKEITTQAAIEEPTQHSEVPAEKTQVMEALVEGRVIDEHALKEYFALSVRQALAQAGTQFPLEKLRVKSIDELHKMAIADSRAMKSLFMNCFEQDEEHAVVLVNEAKMSELSIKELLNCAIKVRDFQKRQLQRSVIKRPSGGSVWIDAAGKMTVISSHRPRVGLPCTNYMSLRRRHLADHGRRS